jgi:hypothetical protein
VICERHPAKTGYDRAMDLLSLDEAQHKSLAQRALVPAPLGARLRCLPSQSAAFVAAGRVAGVLGAGEDQLDPHALPFLGPIVQQRPTGPVVGDDLYWIKTGGAVELELSGALPQRNDTTLGEKVTPRYAARMRVLVSDALRLLGLTLAAGGAGAEQLAKTAAGRALEAALGGAIPLAELTNPGRWAAFAESAKPALQNELAQTGLGLLALELTRVSVPDELAARLRAMAGGTTALAENAAPAAVLGPGARVRASQGGRWFSGQIVALAGAECDVVWDGVTAPTRVALASLEAEPRYPGAHAPGTRVLARWSDGNFVPGVVRVFNGTSYEVLFDHGAVVWLPPGELRMA